MFVIVIMSILSFLMVGAWSLMQHKERTRQAVYSEHVLLKKSELMSAAALYVLEYFRMYEQSIVANHSAEVWCGQYRFTYVFTAITLTGVQVRIAVSDGGVPIDLHLYTIVKKSGKYYCVR